MRRPLRLFWPAVGLFGALTGTAWASSYGDAPPAVAARAAAAATAPVIEACILAAASIHRLPPSMLVVLLDVEGGQLGKVSPNTNETVDIGPMQVNEIWLPQLARHWHASIADTFAALRDNFCANVEGGAWILRLALDKAHGDFWLGVAIYHSHDPGYQAAYLRRVLHQVLRLQAQVDRAGRPPTQTASRG